MAIRPVGSVDVGWRHDDRYVFGPISNTTTSSKGPPGYDAGVSGNAAALATFQRQFGIPFAGEKSGYIIPARVISGWSGAANGGSRRYPLGWTDHRLARS